MSEITYTELVKFLEYNPDTGIFTWKISNGPRAVIGTKAGTLHKDSGYVHIKLNSKQYKAHRLAWLYCFQEWPSEMLDHINGQRNDNCLNNLREATRTENNRNRTKNSNNRTGYRGVSFKKSNNKYVAQIQINGKVKHLGLFDTPELASQAYEAAATEHFKEFKRENTI